MKSSSAAQRALTALVAFLALSTTLFAASFLGGAGDGCDQSGPSGYQDLGAVNVWKYKYYGGAGDGSDSLAMPTYKPLSPPGTVIVVR